MMRSVEGSWLAVCAAGLFAVAPSVAYANAGLPTLAIAWPLSWAALIPIIVIEGYVGRAMADVSWGRASSAAGVANLVSTAVGVPLTWGALLLVQFVTPNGGGGAFGIDTAGAKLFAVTVQAPWLLPWEGHLHWMVPAALLFMLPFLGVVSVYVERPLFRLIARCDKPTARAWSWRANLTTYGIMMAAVLVWFVVAIVTGGN